MIRRVYEKASQSRAESVVVATDDQRVLDEVESFQGLAVMTSTEHLSGTDRVHEAVGKLGLKPDDIVVNVQGDEPLIPVSVIDEVASLITADIKVASLCEPIRRHEDVFDPNLVKVTRDIQSKALYFSRAPIPWHRDGFSDAKTVLPEAFAEGGWYRHLGIYAYTVSLLNAFAAWSPVQQEIVENLEQLRFLVHGESIRVEVTDAELPPGIDTQADAAQTLAVLRKEEKHTQGER